MPTLLLPPRITDDSVKLWRAASRRGWQTHRLGRWHVDDFLRSLPPEDIAVYGGFFIALADDLGISLLEPPLDFLPRLPRHFTGRAVRLTSLAEARFLRGKAFYKPADDKTFIAKVYDSGASLAAPGDLPATLPVLVSDIVNWHVEFRCFILDNDVVTLSPYLRGGSKVETPEGEFPATDEELAAARAFAQTVLVACPHALPPAAVLDVGLMTPARADLPDDAPSPAPVWAVIEANTAWGAGIYGCDPDAVLPVLRRACVPSALLGELDRRWLTLRE